MRPRRRLGALSVSTILAFSAIPFFAGTVAATDVATDAEFRAAWGNPAETLITLTADITLTCDAGGANSTAMRDSATAIVIEGDTHLIHNPCGPAAVFSQDALTQEGTGLVTLRNLRLTGNAESRDGLVTDGGAAIEASTVSGHGGDGIDTELDATIIGSTVSGNGTNGVQSEANVAVSGASTISNNAGGGIESGGSVTVTGSTINGNDVFDCVGGISAGGTVSVTNSTVSQNAEFGIQAVGNITVTGSTIANNVSGECDDGEGILGTGDVSVSTSTVSGNEDDGIRAEGTATVTASTVTDNGNEGIDADIATVTNSTITDNDDAGIFAFSTVTATHATITGNGINIENVELFTIHLLGSVVVDADTVNCAGTVDNQGFNFVDDDSCGTIDAETADPLLGTLGNNGGPTFTRLPAAGSPLLDAIPDDDCELTTEQRGINLRPQGAGCDIGSVEVFVPLPAVSIADAADVLEGSTGTTIEASFTVTLDKSWTRTVTVAYATADGSATAPADYLSESGTVTFVPGDVSETITVTVVGDSLDEPNENFVVNLSAPVEATIADAQGSGTILDDDGPAALSINDVTVTEGDSGFVNATFTVRLLPASSSSVTVAYATANGSATAPSDYESASGTLTFAPGDTEETITVRVAGDTLAEATETFVVTLTTPTGGAIISDSQGTGTILDNDAPAAAALPDTGTVGGLEGWGAAGVALGLLVFSSTVLIRERRRRMIGR